MFMSAAALCIDNAAALLHRASTACFLFVPEPYAGFFLICILKPVVWKCITFCHIENVILLGRNRIPTGRFAAVCMAINTRCDAIHGLLAYERRPKALHFVVIFMRKCRCLDPKMRYLPLVNVVNKAFEHRCWLHTLHSSCSMALSVCALCLHSSSRVICRQTC